MLLIFQCRCRLNREPVNPRPTQEAAIAWRQKAHADAGIGTYNEGCHDDVNKHVWLSIFWGCDVSATGGSDGCSTKAQGEAATGQKALLDLTLHDYARVHFGSLLADSVAAGIYALEQNWVGAIHQNPVVPRTLAMFEEIAAAMTPRNRWSWRLQQLFYRAHYDAFVHTRVGIERAGEAAALAHLKGPRPDIAAAEAVINATLQQSKAATAELWTEMRVWAEAVFQSVHQQFSVPLYGGEYTRRGSNLDLANLPLAASNMPYIFEQLQRAKQDGAAAPAIIRELCSHEASAGGFYDDLGELDAQVSRCQSHEPSFIRHSSPSRGSDD